MLEGSYTDAATGIKFTTWGTPPATDPAVTVAPFTFGLALPGDALTKAADEYIGVLVRPVAFNIRNPSLTL